MRRQTLFWHQATEVVTSLQSSPLAHASPSLLADVLISAKFKVNFFKENS